MCSAQTTLRTPPSDEAVLLGGLRCQHLEMEPTSPNSTYCNESTAKVVGSWTVIFKLRVEIVYFFPKFYGEGGGWIISTAGPGPPPWTRNLKPLTGPEQDSAFLRCPIQKRWYNKMCIWDRSTPLICLLTEYRCL